MKFRAVVLAVLGVGLICFVALAGDRKESYKPKEGYVPDAETAIKIAVAVWTPIYGAARIEKEKPYQATLYHGIWTIKASLHNKKGGVAEADIAKDDGRILRVIHGK